ncbi:MAG TPA: ribulose-phosphate 3-epimerase [Candidatus Eisenbacteria bacterium]|nr:ribulose-phosphate 3-epimerase [Candidatus Eisenbacteria bacterium]
MKAAEHAVRPDSWSKPRRLRMCPSILSADFARLGEEIARVERAGADFLHIDIMDGQFVRNITFGPILVEAMRRLSSLPFDVHLMIVEPLRFLEPFASAGADHLIVHEETVPLREAARAIRARGLKAGGVVKPGTPIERLIEALPDLDIALVMTVEPGKGGQPFLEDSPARIARVREAIDRGGYDCLLQVDGGIAEETIAEAVRAGADTFVAGHSIFRAPDPEQALGRLRAAAERG